MTQVSQATASSTVSHAVLEPAEQPHFIDSSGGSGFSVVLPNVRSEKVQAQFEKRFEQTKVTRKYGVLKTLEFSVIKPIKLMLNSLLGEKFGPSFTEEEREELEIYRQNQAFYKQIGKVQTAHNNYQSAIAKSMVATPEKEEAAATAEYDRAQKLKDSYEALLNLAAEQAEALLPSDQTQKTTVRGAREVEGDGFEDVTLLGTGGTEEAEFSEDEEFFVESQQKCSPEDIEELNRARREELHKVLNLKNPNIIQSVHMAESMLSVVSKVEDTVKYDQERLLDFMARFDAKVEEILTHMGSSDDRETVKKEVSENLMLGLTAITGFEFGILQSIDALAVMSTTRKLGHIDDETRQNMLQDFASVLNDLGNVPFNHASLTPEQRDQEIINLKKSLKEIYFQGMPLISDPASLDKMVGRVQKMQQNAYSLNAQNPESPAAQVQTFTAESARLETAMSGKGDLINHDFTFKAEDWNEFLPVDALNFGGLANPASFDALQQNVEGLRRLKVDIARLEKIDSDAVDAKTVKITEAKMALKDLKDAQTITKGEITLVSNKLEEKFQESKSLEKKVTELTKKVTKVTQSVDALEIDIEAGIQALIRDSFKKVNNDIEAISDNLLALTTKINDRRQQINQADRELQRLEKELEDLITNGIPDENHKAALAAAVQQHNEAKAATITLTGRDLLAIKRQMPGCRPSTDELSIHLEAVEEDNEELEQLSAAKQQADLKLGLAQSNLAELERNIQSDFVELKENRLAIVPEKFFTEAEQRSMAGRLAKSRLRTVELTYGISKKILTQNAVDIKNRPYIKGQTATQRNLQTVTMFGGLSSLNRDAGEFYNAARQSAYDDTSEAEDSAEPTIATEGESSSQQATLPYAVSSVPNNDEGEASDNEGEASGSEQPTVESTIESDVELF